MNKADRAKQFMPFDSLKGFREAIQEKEKDIVPKKILSQDMLDELSAIISSLEHGQIISVVFYSGKSYKGLSGKVSKISASDRLIIIDDLPIKFDDIYRIRL